jgi:hypothetical protein
MSIRGGNVLAPTLTRDEIATLSTTPISSMKTISLTLLLLACLPGVALSKSTEEHIQAIRQIGGILAEYTKAKKATPFAENWKKDDPDDGMAPVTLICNLSDKKIPDRLAFPPFSCHVMPAEELDAYLSKALGRKIVLPRDDRDLKWKGKQMPLFYTVQIREDEFFVATYLTEEHKDARKLSDGWYKFEVGSIAIPAKKITKAVPPAK